MWEIKLKTATLALFEDAFFVVDLQESLSHHQEEVRVFFGSRTFDPISWICKKQSAMSHSSAELEIISLDAGLRMDGLPALHFWECVWETSTCTPDRRNSKLMRNDSDTNSDSHVEDCVFFFETSDHVSREHSQGLAFDETLFFRPTTQQ